ncbi:MAG: hypothetical protein AB1644_05520 [Candidatus Zixiibacteriota bacterium]
MTGSIEQKHRRDLALLEEVDALGEEVKTLALNLAIYLAKIKAEANSEALNRMEPDFIKLVNGTVRVVQEMTAILNAARNMERMVYEVPSGTLRDDRLEARLRSVLEQCGQILGALSQSKDIRA